MIGAHDFFVSFIVFDSGMYKELGRRTRHVVHIFGAMVFQMKSHGVL
jgi:hypothetical protein